MRIFLLVVLLLGVVATGCEENTGGGDASGVRPTATPRPPATPGEPKAPEASADAVPSTPRPADTPVAAESAVSAAGGQVRDGPVTLTVISEDHFEDCLDIAEETIESGIILEELRRTRPEMLTDRERFQWRQELGRVGGYSRASLLYSCMALWSERITPENSDKRNWDFADECVDGLRLRKPDIRSGSEAHRDYRKLLELEYRLQNDAWRVMQGAYNDLSVGDKFALREIVGQGGEGFTARSEYFVDRGCLAFYPQLLVGRWIPAYKQSDDGEKTDWGISLNGLLGVYDGEAIFCVEPDSGRLVPGTNSEWSYVRKRHDPHCVRD